MSTCPSLIYPERPLHPLLTIDFYPDYFHLLTKPFSRNSFLFSSIQNPAGVGVSALNFSTFGRQLPVSPLQSVLTPKQPVTPLESAFTKNAGGGGAICFLSSFNRAVVLCFAEGHMAVGRALISVFDKTGIVGVAKRLGALRIEIFFTRG